jgi:hypothetical protein
MQQVGQGGQAREINDSIIILPSNSNNYNNNNSNSQFPAPRQELVNIYLVKAEDKAVLTEYLENSSCRHVVLV